MVAKTIVPLPCQVAPSGRPGEAGDKNRLAAANRNPDDALFGEESQPASVGGKERIDSRGDGDRLFLIETTNPHALQAGEGDRRTVR